jgi:hypothetical protein
VYLVFIFVFDKFGTMLFFYGPNRKDRGIVIDNDMPIKNFFFVRAMTSRGANRSKNFRKFTEVTYKGFVTCTAYKILFLEEYLFGKI